MQPLFADRRRKLRVLMTADTVGGVWTYSMELSRALSTRGCEIVLATMGGLPSEAQLAEAGEIDGLTLERSTYRLEWMDEPWEDVADAGEWLLQLEEMHGPDIIHLNGYVHAALPFAAPKLVVAHSCVASWWRAVQGNDPPSEWDTYLRHVRKGIAAAECVIAPTESMLQTVEAHHGRLRDGRVISNARDPQLFRSGRKRPFIFSAGRIWDEAKNLSILQAVAPSLPWPVLVAGDDRHPGTAHQQQLDNIRFLGKLNGSGLARWYAESSIYALPAKYEPFGLTALEAALSGCALVLGDIPSLREIWDAAAVFVDPFDEEQLRQELLALIADPIARHEIGARARHRALNFSPLAQAVAYLKVYSELITAATHPFAQEQVG